MNGTDIYDIMKQLGHSQRAQTEEYIKDIVEAKERQNKLKGIGICLDAKFGKRKSPVTRMVTRLFHNS